MADFPSELAFAPAEVEVEQRENGEQILRSPQKLQAYDHSIIDMLQHIFCVHIFPVRPPTIFMTIKNGLMFFASS